jgi:hypothetical protein
MLDDRVESVAVGAWLYYYKKEFLFTTTVCHVEKGDNL